MPNDGGQGRGGQGQGRGQGAGQPRVGGSVRVRGEGGEDVDATITAVNPDGTVNVSLADGSTRENLRKGGQGWRPPEDEDDGTEEEGGTTV